MTVIGQNNGVLETSPKIVSIGTISYPATLVLNSVNVSSKIEISPGNNQWYTPTYTYNTANQKVATLTAPFAFIRFTGSVNDTYAIL